MTNDVAKTILAQLGGGMFVMMTGAKNFVGSVDALSFRLPRFDGGTKGVNTVRIVLKSDDTYLVSFLSLRGVKCRTVAMVDGVYADQLRAVFTANTGLDTSMGTIRRAA